MKEKLRLIKRKKIDKLNLPGVYGFLNELIFPSHKTYETALKVGLIKFMNYLIVDTISTAKLCSQYFKENDLSIDIVIIENIINSEINYGRANFGQYGEYLSNFISYKNKDIKVAVDYFLKGIVFCFESNNVSKLKQLGVNNIILEDGTIFKSGAITGGAYKNIDSIEFTKEDIKKLREEYINLEEAYNKKSNSIIQLNELISKSDHRLKQYNLSKDTLVELLKVNKIKQDNLKQEQYKCKESLNNMSIEIDSLTTSFQRSKNTLNNINESINNARNKALGDFFKKVKIDVSQGECTLQDIQILETEKREIEDKINKYNSELSHNKDREAEIKALEQELNELKADKDELLRKKESLKTKYQESKASYDHDVETSLSSKEGLQKLRAHIKLVESELEKIDIRVRAIYKSKVEYNFLIESSLKAKSNIIDDFVNNLSSYLFKYKTSLVLNISFDPQKYILHMTNGENGQCQYEIDYVLIDTSKSPSSEINILEDLFQQKLIEKELYLNASIKSNENVDNLIDKQKEFNDNKKVIESEILNLIKRKDIIISSLYEVTNLRKNKFELFLSQLSDEVNNIYRLISVNSTDRKLGGSASIYNTNSSEPYLGNSIFLPIPPGKSYIFDFDSLSGGEKTIGIVALIFALQKLTQVPFIVLDEIDAYLDISHDIIIEELITNYLKTNVKSQLILISHKHHIFSSSDTLIGIYKNESLKSSIPISLDMTRYDNE